MGKLRKFKKIKWKPFQVREGSISVTNYFTDKEGKNIPVQSHLDIPRYSFFEILKWEPNPYYGKLQEYLDNDWVVSFGGSELRKGSKSITLSSFTNNPEICFMLACWTNMDHDERSPDLKFVQSRPMGLAHDEMVVFMKLAKTGQSHIEKVLDKCYEMVHL